MAESRWVKCISGSGTIRGVAIEATELVREMAVFHKSSSKDAQGLGEAVLSGLLLASYCKPGERVNLNIRGSGLYGQAFVDARPDGTVRGYVSHRDHSFSSDTIGPWGEGLMSVLRTKDQEGQQPYIGTVPLVTGHLAKDFTFYWVQSEQVPSSVGLTVRISDDGKVDFAGAFLVQAMPGATLTEIAAIENQIQHYAGYENEFADHQNPKQVLANIFGDSTFMILEEKNVEMKCDCSIERVERALALVGADEIQAMLKDDGKASVKCDFCAKEYTFEQEGLEKILAKIQN